MLVRADQLKVGDQLVGGDVVWVLPTPDYAYLVVGLRTRPRKPGNTPRSKTLRLRPDESVATIDSGQD